MKEWFYSTLKKYGYQQSSVTLGCFVFFGTLASVGLFCFWLFIKRRKE